MVTPPDLATASPVRWRFLSRAPVNWENCETPPLVRIRLLR